jgi:DNA-binding IclR family transcriptional regulator
MADRKQKNEKNKSSYNPYVPAVEQACRVLISLGQSAKAPLNLTDICQQAGIHKSKGHNILNTLVKYGLVNKDLQAKTYSLGVGLLFLARNVLDNLNFREVSAPHLAELSRRLNSTAVFGVISGDQFFVVAKDDGNLDIGLDIAVGRRFHLTLGAHGKAIVAHLSPANRKAVLAQEKLYFYGDPAQTARGRDDLEKELEEVRRKGYAKDAGRVQPGINAVAAPVFGYRKELIGALVVIGTFLPSLITAYGPITAETARLISKGLGAE